MSSKRLIIMHFLFLPFLSALFLGCGDTSAPTSGQVTSSPNKTIAVPPTYTPTPPPTATLSAVAASEWGMVKSTGGEVKDAPRNNANILEKLDAYTVVGFKQKLSDESWWERIGGGWLARDKIVIYRTEAEARRAVPIPTATPVPIPTLDPSQIVSSTSGNSSLKALDDVIASNPNNSGGYNNRGIEYLKRREYDNAINDFNRAIQLDPFNDLAYYNRGLARWGQKKYQEALADFDKSIQLGTKSDEPYLAKGVVHAVLKQYQEAINDFNTLIKISPNNGKAYFNRGDTYRLLGTYDQAIQDYNKALTLIPKEGHSVIYRVIGYAYKGKGDKESARKAFQKAVELGDNVSKDELAKL